jgi:hypothetical protein
MPLLKLFPLGWRILRVAYEIFVPLDLGGGVLPLSLDSGELFPGFIDTLRGARDCRFLPLQAIEENLCSLRCDGRCLQILPQLAYFR